jgi:eukaryotic-like serine/threonine-protein kinase
MTVEAQKKRVAQFAASRWIITMLALLGFVYAVNATARAAEPPPYTTVSDNAKQAGHSLAPLGLAWKFQSVDKGFIDSTPVVDGERAYISVSNHDVFKPSGTLFCLGKTINDKKQEEWKIVWRFDNGGKMKEVFCSPRLADGKVFIGEGFHQDIGCSMYCLEAATGKKLWQFKTESHTESTPFYWEGKLYFGAGDDGFYCLDAVKGESLWHYQNKLHIDANPSVVAGRVYCSSGVGDAFQNTAIFCLDAKTGKELWLVKTDLPVWGGATVDGDRVYFGMGNEGYATTEEKSPKGALLCVERDTGKRLWRFDVKGAIVCHPATDGEHLFLGSRDNFCYCLDRREGKVIWKKDLGSPVLASPALTRCLGCGDRLCLYTSTDEGKLFALSPTTGQTFWTFDALKASGIKPTPSSPPAQFFSSPFVVQTRTETGEKHRIHFGCGVADDFGYKAILFCFEAEIK